jgi:predicted Na+-dependent transporter
MINPKLLTKLSQLHSRKQTWTYKVDKFLGTMVSHWTVIVLVSYLAIGLIIGEPDAPYRSFEHWCFRAESTLMTFVLLPLVGFGLHYFAVMMDWLRGFIHK